MLDNFQLFKCILWVLLHKGGSIASAASQNGVCIAQQMCHIMIFFHDSSMIKDEGNEKSNVFCHFFNNICFLMKGKLTSTNSVL
jgi:hypothetical protein